MASQRESRPAGNQAASSESTATADGPESSRSRTVYVGVVDGQPIITAEAGELLFGIPAAEIRAGMTAGMVDGTEPYPAEWLRSARRRAAEARAATGDSSILAGLTYWARRDLGVDLIVRTIQ